MIDLGQPGCVEQIVHAREILSDRKVTLTGTWDRDAVDGDDPFAIRLPTLLVANKADAIPDIEGDLDVCRELGDLHFPTIVVSAETGEGIDAIGPWLFRNLDIVRVYTKVPGKEPDMDRPYTVRHGATVEDVSRLVHRDLAASFHHAGSGVAAPTTASRSAGSTSSKTATSSKSTPRSANPGFSTPYTAPSARGTVALRTQGSPPRIRRRRPAE